MWKHFVEECLSVSDTLCYSFVMTFWGSFKFFLCRWRKLNLSLCIKCFRTISLSPVTVCGISERQTSVNNISEELRVFLSYRCSFFTVFEIKTHSLKNAWNYPFQNRSRQTLMFGLDNLEDLFQPKWYYD